VLGLGERTPLGPHPDGEFALTEEERTKFNYWVLLGAQYK
jgi:hypothetical protein